MRPLAHTTSTHEQEKRRVVGTAFYRAAAILQLKAKEIQNLIGISEPTISRHKQRIAQKVPIGFSAKEEEAALFFLRIFRSLDTLFGGNEDQMRAWFDADNVHLRGKPKDLIQTIGGLVHVAGYLDAMRGKI